MFKLRPRERPFEREREKKFFPGAVHSDGRFESLIGTGSTKIRVVTPRVPGYRTRREPGALGSFAPYTQCIPRLKRGPRLIATTLNRMFSSECLNEFLITIITREATRLGFAPTVVQIATPQHTFRAVHIPNDLRKWTLARAEAHVGSDGNRPAGKIERTARSRIVNP